MGNGVHCGVKVTLFLIILKQIAACIQLHMLIQGRQSNIWKICHSLLSFVPWRHACHDIFAADGMVLKGFIKVRKHITYIKNHNKLGEEIVKEWVFKLG